MGEVVSIQDQRVPQSDFDRIWERYPRKVAKKAALRALDKAKRDPDWPGIEAVLEAIETYKRNKPDYCDYCHLSTWLNQGRWMDEYEDDSRKIEMRDATPEEAARYYREIGRDRLAELCLSDDPPPWLAFKVPVGWT